MKYEDIVRVIKGANSNKTFWIYGSDLDGFVEQLDGELGKKSVRIDFSSNPIQDLDVFDETTEIIYLENLFCVTSMSSSDKILNDIFLKIFTIRKLPNCHYFFQILH